MLPAPLQPNALIERFRPDREFFIYPLIVCGRFLPKIEAIFRLASKPAGFECTVFLP